MTGDDPLLSVRDLEVHYPVRSGLLRRVTDHVRAVDGVSFDLHEGESLGLVGESGCGKSTTARAVLGLDDPTGGEVRLDGDLLDGMSRGERREFRRRVQMVFQDPTTAFDPRMTVGESVAEPLRIHGLHTEHARDVAEDLLERVGMAADDADRYPEEFSGGEKQRIALARALTLDPDLLVVDEPVSALDASVQAEILALLDDLRDAYGLAVLFISHDLGVVREVCDRVAVMYLGQLVETAPTEALFERPTHPYTEALLSSIPRPEPGAELPAELDGDVPDPTAPPAGCSFHPRCPRVIPPEEHDLSSESFARIVAFRRDLRSGDATLQADAAAIRAANDLPSDLDDDAGVVLSAALEAAASGDVEAAIDRLEGMETVCEHADPALVSVGSDRRAACHHHDHDTGWPPDD